MNNRTIFFILLFFLSTLFFGLEIAPTWAEKRIPIRTMPPFEALSKELTQSLLQKTCLACHSIKYNDAFTYTKSDYDAVEKRYGALPMDLSLVGKIYSKASLYASLQEPKAHHEGIDKEHLPIIVEYLFEEKNKDEHEKTGLFVVGFMALFSLLIYLKILIQRPEHPHV